MQIDFFEEFSTKDNLEKAKLIKFPCTVYLAAKSVKEFRILERKLISINIQLVAAYWPILEKSYWISPFSNREELELLVKDLTKREDSRKLKVLFDLEFPFFNKFLFLKNLPNYIRNKKLIRNTIKAGEKFGLQIVTAENPRPLWLLNFFGLTYGNSNHRILMYYSSIERNEFLRGAVRNIVLKELKRFGNKLQIGLGTIAKGILGNEPILSPEGLRKDLEFFKEKGIKNVVIFRLGGLNEMYLGVVEEFNFAKVSP